MIKSLSLLSRREGITHEEFLEHWTQVHAPLAHEVPGLRRYVLTHILATRERPDIPSMDVEVDGIAELWYDDQAALQAANASSQAKRLHDDGATFIGRIQTFTTYEQTIIPKRVKTD
ncbi:EthD family reductase [Verticiella sediminum]|uniref:EthD family reductase n=1 Tax=Verticiella sediminum TaxID=1247510 RepID=A0A556AKK6_9BURK|nr:EthD domain-containing protein [Verticiella sediminum]TSH93424.1 EthD family reductase [Verticiella sediminum]